jgi:hypothetical protein
MKQLTAGAVFGLLAALSLFRCTDTGTNQNHNGQDTAVHYTLLKAIPLIHPNPFTPLVRTGDKLYIASADWAGTNGGLEEIDAVTLQNNGVKLGQAALGGVITDLCLADSNRLLVAWDDFTKNRVSGFRLSDYTALGAICSTASFKFSSMAVADTLLLVCDKYDTIGHHQGVYAFNLSNGALAAGPVFTGATPMDIETGNGTAVVVNMAGTGGSIATIRYGDGSFNADTLADVLTTSDNILRWRGDTFYLIDRTNGAISQLGSDYAILGATQFSVGQGTNPQDLAWMGDSLAFVPRLASPRILAVNPQTGDSLWSIDLSAWADSTDHSPEASAVCIKGDTLFVAIQRLVNYAPVDTSYILAFKITE